MKNSISLSIYALCMSAALCGCGQAQSGGTVRNQVMDPAVSYTHLDVYKRQMQCCVDRLER